MISFEQALHIIRERAGNHHPDTETIPLAQAAGRISAQELQAPLTIQPFDNSAMDGFAVRLSDLNSAGDATPVRLKKAGIIAAGDAIPTDPLQSGTCVHIMTGAPVPEGADAVVPIECVTVQDTHIVFKAVPQPMANIRRAGEDFHKGDTILHAGDAISTAHILPLATLGISRLLVYKKPKVAFMATGRELVDNLAAPLDSGQIYNSNRPYALAVLEILGCDVLPCETIRDNPDMFCGMLENLMNEQCDIIISSGAVSAGAFDFVKDGLEALGADIVFHKIKLKPGKPNLFAILPNGTLYFGLPGNPVASAVGLRFFITAALRAMMGRPPEQPLYARTTSKFVKKSGLHMILKGKNTSREDGTCHVDILDGQASFMVSPFLQMDGWVHIPEDKEIIDSGEVVTVYPLHPQS